MTWKQFRKFATGLTKLWQLRLMAVLLSIQPAKSTTETRRRIEEHCKAQPQDEEARIAVTQGLLDKLLELATPATAAEEEPPNPEAKKVPEGPTLWQRVRIWLKNN